MVHIKKSVSITGPYAEEHLAQVVCVSDSRPGTMAVVRRTKQKKWPPRRTATLVFGNLFRCLPLQETPRHTERAKGGAEQHHRRATIGNAVTARAAERRQV
jgi:hypothetical protein